MIDGGPTSPLSATRVGAPPQAAIATALVMQVATVKETIPGSGRGKIAFLIWCHALVEWFGYGHDGAASEPYDNAALHRFMNAVNESRTKRLVPAHPYARPATNNHRAPSLDCNTTKIITKCTQGNSGPRAIG